MMETYYGFVRTPADAIKLFEACRLGLLPRVQRRLSEKERQSIRSGSVFVWDEREAGMRRWTDGKSWSASRVSGSFLTYKEMEGKRGTGFGSGRRGAGKTPDSGRGSDEDQDDGEPDGYRYKADGLMKQSFSITTSSGQHLHLISYYSRPHPGQPELPQPSSDSNLRHILPVKGMYPESSMTEAPTATMTRSQMQHTIYVGPQQQAPPHQPSQSYPPQYAQPGYSWPPSPVATPPYSHGHYTVSAYPQNQQPPPPYPYAPAPQHQQYHPAPMTTPTYDRAPLPPPQPTAGNPKGGIPPAPYAHSAHHPRESPRSSHIPTYGREGGLIDPRLTSSSAGPGARHGPAGLPPLVQMPHHAPLSATPPPRGQSVSPPRSSHSEMSSNGVPPHYNKASLSALLLHPTPASSEPNSANPGSNSAGSSPRAGVGPMPGPMQGHLAQSLAKRPLSEDARALNVLDKKFCI